MQRLKELDLDLMDSIVTHAKGQESEVDQITIVAPSAKNRKHAFELKQSFARAMMAQQEKATEAQKAAAAKQTQNSDDSDISSSEIVMMMLASDENFDRFNETFKSLLLAGCAKVGEDKMTAFHYDQLSIDDAENILGEYLKHFLLASLLQQ